MLKPGDTIGILGGGQLARMLALAAAPLGLKCHIFAPEGDNPAFDVAAAHTVADYRDEAALLAFASSVSVVTYEFENVPAETAEILIQKVPVLPSPKALAVTQDRLTEKSFIRSLGLPVADFAEVSSLPSCEDALARIGRPSVLKTRRMGYDGKGQITVRDGISASDAWQKIGAAPAILEAFVSFEREVSVIAARSAKGECVAYDVCENRHSNHILAETVLPAAISSETEARAKAAAFKIAEALDYVGVLGVEFFIAGSGANEMLVVNEIAPRVHNSGHWTLGGAETSQFEQHIRAVAGWPLGSVERLGRIVMENLIGDEIDRWSGLLTESGAKLELYGKKEARPGRKMGHVTRVFRTAE